MLERLVAVLAAWGIALTLAWVAWLAWRVTRWGRVGRTFNLIASAVLVVVMLGWVLDDPLIGVPAAVAAACLPWVIAARHHHEAREFRREVERRSDERDASGEA